MARMDPLRNFRFRLEIDGITQAGFSEVLIGETAIDVVEYREGTDPPHVQKMSGLTKNGEITFKRGVTTDAGALDLFRWHDDISAGLIQERRRKLTIIVQREDGVDAARFVVSDAWPTKYDPSDLNAKGNETFIETYVVVHHGIQRV